MFSVQALPVTSSTASSTSATLRLHRILCYGDSLTAGTSGMNLYPYAQFLEQGLKKARPDMESNFVVRHRGMPGWTAQYMLDEALNDPKTGLLSAIQSVKDPPLSLVIILAGTNDLGYGMSEEEITESVLGLHKVAWENGVARTIAIAIPPSGYQNVNEQARKTVKAINTNLEKACSSTDKAVFVPFPFDYEEGGENWFPDTLHFSERGYQALGESLVPVVLSALDKIERQGSWDRLHKRLHCLPKESTKGNVQMKMS